LRVDSPWTIVHSYLYFAMVYGLWSMDLKMYIIKVKGVAKIPDYVQLRDDKFTLLAYFRVDRPEKSLDKIGLGARAGEIMTIVKELPFGQILKLDL
jgi:hypothetical protein